MLTISSLMFPLTDGLRTNGEGAGFRSGIVLGDVCFRLRREGEPFAHNYKEADSFDIRNPLSISAMGKFIWAHEAE